MGNLYIDREKLERAWYALYDLEQLPEMRVFEVKSLREARTLVSRQLRQMEKQTPDAVNAEGCTTGRSLMGD